MGGFQSGHSREKQGILKIKRIFFKTRSFRSAQVGKAEQRIVYFWKGGLLKRPRSKNVASPPHPLPPRRTEVSSRQHAIQCDVWGIASAKQVPIIIYFIFKTGVGMFSIMWWGPNLQIFQKLSLYQKITISYMHIYDFDLFVCLFSVILQCMKCVYSFKYCLDWFNFAFFSPMLFRRSF